MSGRKEVTFAFSANALLERFGTDDDASLPLLPDPDIELKPKTAVQAVIEKRGVKIGDTSQTLKVNDNDDTAAFHR